MNYFWIIRSVLGKSTVFVHTINTYTIPEDTIKNVAYEIMVTDEVSISRDPKFSFMNNSRRFPVRSFLERGWMRFRNTGQTMIHDVR